MRRALLIFGLSASLLAFAAVPSRAQLPDGPIPQLPPASFDKSTQQIDGVAARIEDDIITESEVRELGAFQALLDGQSKSREELIRELADQWIVRGEAATANYPQPSSEDVNRSYSQLEKQFPSPDEFKRRVSAAGLSDAAVRRMLAQQLYLARFLDFRFRPAAQVTDQQIADYYKTEFAVPLQKRGQPVPALDEVNDAIREVLVQRAINDRATSWMDDTRERLRIDVIKPGTSP